MVSKSSKKVLSKSGQSNKVTGFKKIAFEKNALRNKQSTIQKKKRLKTKFLE